MRHQISEDIYQAISDTPTIRSVDGHVTLMSGAMSVRSSLSDSLSRAISSNNRPRLLVPHAYALPHEVASLQEDFDGNVVTFSERVYVSISSGDADAQIVRRALACMIGCYSVAWLFEDAALVHPVIAIVPIFDGDGFALVAPSRTSIRKFLPDIPAPISH